MGGSESWPISPRELEILKLRAEGLPIKAVAARLHLAVGTVRTYAERTLAKLGARSVTHALSILEAKSRQRDIDRAIQALQLLKSGGEGSRIAGKRIILSLLITSA